MRDGARSAWQRKGREAEAGADVEKEVAGLGPSPVTALPDEGPLFRPLVVRHLAPPALDALAPVGNEADPEP